MGARDTSGVIHCVCRYSEAEALEGPWEAAVKVVTHSTTGMSFYNPTQHVMFDEAGGELIYLSGTFLTTFSNNAVPVPRYKCVGCVGCAAFEPLCTCHGLTRCVYWRRIAATTTSCTGSISVQWT